MNGCCPSLWSLQARPQSVLWVKIACLPSAHICIRQASYLWSCSDFANLPSKFACMTGVEQSQFNLFFTHPLTPSPTHLLTLSPTHPTPHPPSHLLFSNCHAMFGTCHCKTASTFLVAISFLCLQAQQQDFYIDKDNASWLQQELLDARKEQGNDANSFHKQLTV